MNRTTRTCFALALLVPHVCQAQETRVPDTGALFCSRQEEAHELLIAIARRDGQWVDALKSCTVLKGGLRYVAIDDKTVDEAAGSYQHVRVFGERISAEGYLLSFKEGFLPHPG